MGAWDEAELSEIAVAQELDLASVRPDGTLRRPVTMWVVRVGDEVYVRSVNGRGSSWFRGAENRHEAEIRAGRVAKDVTLVESDELNDEIDALQREVRRSLPQHHPLDRGCRSSRRDAQARAAVAAPELEGIT
jgi:hypothetical protein